MVECLDSSHKVQSSIPNTRKKKDKRSNYVAKRLPPPPKTSLGTIKMTNSLLVLASFPIQAQRVL